MKMYSAQITAGFGMLGTLITGYNYFFFVVFAIFLFVTNCWNLFSEFYDELNNKKHKK